MTTTERALLRLLCVNAYNLYCETIVGLSPFLKKVNERIKEPVIGDIVMETSTIWTPERDEHRIGRFLRIEHRPMRTEAEWRAEWAPREPEGEIPTDPHTIIEPLVRPGTEYSWYNASFILVPAGIATGRHDEPTFSRRRTKGGADEWDPVVNDGRAFAGNQEQIAAFKTMLHKAGL
jgi:hypothetical protein